MNTFFISDLHLGHYNIIKYDKRPVETCEEEDKIIIDNWNSVVTKDDEVWILGDVSWYPSPKTVSILRQLNGKKNLVVGNHDKKQLKDPAFRSCFGEITDYKEIYLDKKHGIVLSHYPIMCFNHHLQPEWIHLYGHVHTTKEYDLTLKWQNELENNWGIKIHMYNVGCMIDYMNYTPRTLDEIIKRG